MSEREPPPALRPLILPQRQIYDPMIALENPRKYYVHVSSSKLDVMTSVSVKISNGTQYRNGTLYGIRKYRAVKTRRIGEPCHEIEDLMIKFKNCKIRLMHHLLMPIQLFSHYDEGPSISTVSEHGLMTLGTLLRGVKGFPSMMCHDDIWSIVQQILSGLEFLAMFGYQHNKLSLQNILITGDYTVKIGGLRHIRTQTPEGYRMLNELRRMIESLISNGPAPCSYCIDTCCSVCGTNTNGSCCDGNYMRSQVVSLRSIIEDPMNPQKTLTELIGRVKGVDFISQAQGLRLPGVVHFAGGKAWHDQDLAQRDDSDQDGSDQDTDLDSDEDIDLRDDSNLDRDNSDQDDSDQDTDLDSDEDIGLREDPDEPTEEEP